MGKLERDIMQRGWCSLEVYKQLKKLNWYDKLLLRFKSVYHG